MAKTPEKNTGAKRKTGSSSAKKAKKSKKTPAEKQAEKEAIEAAKKAKFHKEKLEELQELFEKTIKEDGSKKISKSEQNGEGDGEMEEDTEEDSWWPNLKVPFETMEENSEEENSEEEEECSDSDKNAKEKKNKVKEFISELQKLLDEKPEQTVDDDGLVELAQKLVQKLFDFGIVPKEDQHLFCHFVGLCLQWMNAIKTSGFFEFCESKPFSSPKKKCATAAKKPAAKKPTSESSPEEDKKLPAVASRATGVDDSDGSSPEKDKKQPAIGAGNKKKAVVKMMRFLIAQLAAALWHKFTIGSKYEKSNGEEKETKKKAHGSLTTEYEGYKNLSLLPKKTALRILPYVMLMIRLALTMVEGEEGKRLVTHQLTVVSVMEHPLSIKGSALRGLENDSVYLASEMEDGTVGKNKPFITAAFAAHLDPYWPEPEEFETRMTTLEKEWSHFTPDHKKFLKDFGVTKKLESMVLKMEAEKKCHDLIPFPAHLLGEGCDKDFNIVKEGWKHGEPVARPTPEEKPRTRSRMLATGEKLETGDV